MNHQALISEPRQAAARLAGNAELLDVRAARFTAELRDPSASGPFELTLKVQPSCAIETADDEAWLLIYAFDYDLTVGREASPVAKLTCTFSQTYRAPTGGEDYADEEWKAFGDTTVMLSLYPYVRQFVQDSMARFNLGPVVLPGFREPMGPDVGPPTETPTTGKQRQNTQGTKAKSLSGRSSTGRSVTKSAAADAIPAKRTSSRKSPPSKKS